MKELKRQDRNGVRKASDIEQKYKLNEMKKKQEEIANNGKKQPIDLELSETSSNPLQNKTIAKKFKEIELEKVNVEEGKGLSTNDFSDQYKEKLDSLIGDLASNRISQIITLGTVIEDEYEITVPNYIVGDNSLEVYWDGKLLKRATNDEYGHYKEVGKSREVSTKIQISRTEEDGSYILTKDVVLECIIRKKVIEE